MSAHTPEDSAADDALAARIAASIPESYSPEFRRQLVRLYTHQALGMAAAPGRITQRELGSYLALTPQRISDLECIGLALCRLRLTAAPASSSLPTDH